MAQQPAEISVDGLRAKILDEIRSSGLSQNAFAKSHGVLPHKLSEFLSGKRDAEPAIVEPLGYRWALVAADGTPRPSPGNPDAETASASPENGLLTREQQPELVADASIWRARAIRAEAIAKATAA